MKAAATLTSLLYHGKRPSIGGTSPRSSVDGSDAGSSYSYSHFAQSSARTTNVAPSPPSTTPPASAPLEDSLRHTTPTPSSAPVVKQTTPRALPTDKDSEAADLMLFLATSPSPARPNKAKDQAAYQSLAGAPSARPKGRVLFQASSVADLPSGDAPGATLRPPSTLSRSGEGSFVSSLSSIGSEVGSNHHVSPALPPPGHQMQQLAGPGGAQLLPPPSLSSTSSAAMSMPMKDGLPAVRNSPRPSSANPPSQGTPIDFNINEFINTSPSPSRSAMQPGKMGHSLRADVGRRLFEEEQMRYAQSMAAAVNRGHGVQGEGSGQQKSPGIPQARVLGAGIDIAQS